ncbi:MAG: YjgN family protein [Pseudomonadota bacterium]
MMKDMDDTLNYSAYSVEELKDALSNVDKNAFPDRAQAILTELTNRKSHEDTITNGRKAKVLFHGNGKEYFSIWIVNLLLTIVTLGIYSAWATVRNNRYFYSNTDIDGHRFGYLAEPIQILIGRIIGVLLFVAYYLASSFSPMAAVVVMLIIFALVPMFVCLSASFRMRMTAYRNIRFNFTKNYSRAYIVFVGYTLLGMLSFGLLYPWLLKKIDEFMLSHATYGDKSFIPKLETGQYYAAAILSFLSALGIGIVGGSAFASIGFGAMGENAEVGSLFIVGSIFMYAFVFVVAGSIYQAMIRNHMYNNTELESVASFSSDVKIGGLILLRMTNLLMLVVSLGFLMPWIKVRTAQFFVDATQLNIEEGAEDVLADQTQSGNAIGEEVAGAFDIDVALG